MAAQEKSQVETRIQELKQFIQQDETKKIKKRENLVQGFDEGNITINLFILSMLELSFILLTSININQVLFISFY